MSDLQMLSKTIKYYKDEMLTCHQLCTKHSICLWYETDWIIGICFSLLGRLLSMCCTSTARAEQVFMSEDKQMYWTRPDNGMLWICVLYTEDDSTVCFLVNDDSISAKRGKWMLKWLTNLPMHGVQMMWLVMVPPLMVAHVDRYRRMEGWE